jgi:hypothetical protein
MTRLADDVPHPDAVPQLIKTAVEAVSAAT